MNKVMICNLALSHVGVSPINSVDDKTKQARECKLLYEHSVESALRDHAWGFASKRVTLALFATAQDGYAFAYQYPADCVAARKMLDSGGLESASPFVVAVSSALTEKLILTDQGEALLRYTARVTNENLFDPLFVDALAWRLASDLASPMRGDTSLQRTAWGVYQHILGRAKAQDGNEAKYGEGTSDNPYADARG